MGEPTAMPAHRTDFRPHDLLWIADASLLASDQGLPDWASDSWLRRAPVVVRRESTNGGCIPVGLRGANRSDRVKAYLPASAVLRCTRPEDIVAARPWRRQSHLARFAAVLGLERLAERLQATGLQWGPTGGVGFTLASGIPVLRWDSDLDLVIRSPAPLTMALCASLSALGAVAGCRLDMQIDTGLGAFAFAEWIGGARRVMLKTGAGPILTGDPWNADDLVETLIPAAP